MINVNGKNLDLVVIKGKEVGQMMTEGHIIIEAGNFQSADGMILRTADKFIFNAKKVK